MMIISALPGLSFRLWLSIQLWMSLRQTEMWAETCVSNEEKEKIVNSMSVLPWYIIHQMNSESFQEKSQQKQEDWN